MKKPSKTLSEEASELREALIALWVELLRNKYSLLYVCLVIIAFLFGVATEHNFPWLLSFLW